MNPPALASTVCPRCGLQKPWRPDTGTLDEVVCRGCAGRFVPTTSAQQLLARLGLEPARLKELLEHFMGDRLRCPGCRGLMSPARLRGVHLDVCTLCGGLWMDAGELARFAPDVLEVGKPDATNPTVLHEPFMQVGPWKVRNTSERTLAETTHTSWGWVAALLGVGVLLAGVSPYLAVAAVAGLLYASWSGLPVLTVRLTAEPGRLQITHTRAGHSRGGWWTQGTLAMVTRHDDEGPLFLLVLVGDGGTRELFRQRWQHPVVTLGRVLAQRTGWSFTEDQVDVDTAP